MATFVLVHGAWGGAHTFHLVRPKLHASGHDVFTPALTGLGERSYLVSPQITLDTHVEDVVNVILYWNLRDVVLLGYSYGGMVVTGALQRIADRVAHLIYLDAFVPSNGESLALLAGGDRVQTLGSPWFIEPLERGDHYHDDDEEAVFLAARRSLQPVKTFTTPVVLEQPLEAYAFSRTYIKATGEPRPEPAIWIASDRAQASPAWRYREIATNHAIPINRPDELVRFLTELVE